GTATGTLIISKAPAGISLSGLLRIFDGAPKPVSVATNPNGLDVVVTYDGMTTPPTNAGSYAVVATINSLNYSGSTSGTLKIAPAPATVVLSNLMQAYDGSPKFVTVTTTPANLSLNVTYSGGPMAPTGPGTYPVVATVTNPN